MELTSRKKLSRRQRPTLAWSLNAANPRCVSALAVTATTSRLAAACVRASRQSGALAITLVSSDGIGVSVRVAAPVVGPCVDRVSGAAGFAPTVGSSASVAGPTIADVAFGEASILSSAVKMPSPDGPTDTIKRKVMERGGRTDGADVHVSLPAYRLHTSQEATITHFCMAFTSSRKSPVVAGRMLLSSSATLEGIQSSELVEANVDATTRQSIISMNSW